MATRTHAREAVVELLYAYTIGNNDIRKFADDLLAQKKIKNAQATFALGLFDGVIENLNRIDEIIRQNLKSWDFEKIGVIDKCIIRLGVYEAIYNNLDTPIIINEAIEIAKILGGDNTPRFVNGLLDGIIKQAKSSETSPLGMQCSEIADFVECTDTKSANIPQNPQCSHSHTANTGSLDSNENPKLSLRESETSEAIYDIESKSVKSKFIDCHASANAESRNDKNTDSSDFDKNRNKINATLSQTAKSVVGGEGESCERGRGERLRHSSPLSLSQNRINESNEVAARNKKESKQNLNLSLRESKANEAIQNTESKSVESNTKSKIAKSKVADCHDLPCKSRNDKNAKSTKSKNATNPLKDSTKNKNPKSKKDSKQNKILKQNPKNSTHKGQK